jgi:hypothetical protein
LTRVIWLVNAHGENSHGCNTAHQQQMTLVLPRQQHKSSHPGVTFSFVSHAPDLGPQ